MRPANDAQAMRECLLCSAAIVMLATPRLWAGSTTAFQLGDQGGVIVPVMMNGRGPFMMLLDTGASHSAITEGAATAIGARAVARSNVITPTDTAIRTIVVVDELVLGPHAVDLALPSLVADRALDAAGAIHGLIGQDVLAGLRYTLDFRQRRIEWHDRPIAESGVTLTLAYEHGRFVVDLPQHGSTLRLVPDSGAGGLVLFSVAGGIRHNIVETGRTVELTAAGTRRLGRQVVIKELRLGGRLIRDLPAVALERPDRHPSEGDGLLPLHLFERVTFDGPRRVMIVG